MTRIYAIEEISGDRVLVRLTCDEIGCDAFIKPHADIAQSSWTKRGWSDGRDSFENDYCPEHS